jgi:hypothetical protein
MVLVVTKLVYQADSITHWQAKNRLAIVSAGLPFELNERSVYLRMTFVHDEFGLSQTWPRPFSELACGSIGSGAEARGVAPLDARIESAHDDDGMRGDRPDLPLISGASLKRQS